MSPITTALLRIRVRLHCAAPPGFYCPEALTGFFSVLRETRIQKSNSEALERLRTGNFARKSAHGFEPVCTPIAHRGRTAVPLASCERSRSTAYFSSNLQIKIKLSLSFIYLKNPEPLHSRSGVRINLIIYFLKYPQS